MGRKQSRSKRKNFSSHRNNDFLKTEGGEGSSTTRSSKNCLVFLWSSFSNSIEERKKILKDKKILMEEQINYLKLHNKSRIELI